MFSSSARMPFYSTNFNRTNSPWTTHHIKLEVLLFSIMVASLLMTSTTSMVLDHKPRKNINEMQTNFAPSDQQAFEKDANEFICITPGCVRTAAEIIQTIDEKVNPCDNFYKFACGGWLNKHSIPDDKSQVSVFDDVQDELNIQLKGLLEKPSDKSEIKSIKMVKDMYNSCMELDNIEKAGSEPLQDVLNKFGGWPVVMGDRWDGSKFDWMESLFEFRKLGYDHTILIAIIVMVDLKDNTRHKIYLDQASLGMPDRTYLLDGLTDPATKAYFNMMVKAAKKLGANEETVEKELLEVLNFETTLANYSLPKEERRDFNSMYHKYSIPQLRELVPQIDWLKYLNGLLDNPITETETVIVNVPNFLKQFGELIKKTDKRIVANYMMWRVVSESMDTLSKEWRAMLQEYVSAISGQTQERPRSEQCMNTLSGSLGIALSSYYIKYYFTGDSRQKATEMVKYISDAFLTILDKIDWMDEETRKQAKEKAKAITPYIGYPKELMNDSMVIQHYNGLSVTRENYFDNTLHIKKWLIDDIFSKLEKPNIKGDWKDHANAAVVNAYYNPLDNSIEFPAGILQKIFYDHARPNYMNFGGIGFVIGHEITHGFDDTGKQFDKDGNNKNWWDDNTDKLFKEKAKCLIDQYGNYTTEIGLKVNGVNTQGENIADNGGIKEAYQGYLSWVKDYGSEGRLPGLRYTPQQLFFISAANVWCGKYKPEYLKLLIFADSHSPGEFRVIGTLSNFKEFSTTFGCPLGSNMNPEKKCEVW